MSRKSRSHRHHSSLRRRTPPGAAPGTLIADPHAPFPKMQLIAYGPDAIVEKTIQDPQIIREHVDKWPVLWINVDGLGDAATIQMLGNIFGLHRLALEDVVNVYQRPKVEQFQHHTFIVARMVEMQESLQTEQLSIFLGRSFVLTFQERPGDCFDLVRERIRKAGGRIRSAGPDYLAYALLDAIIDEYFPVMEKMGERLEDLEEQVVVRPAHPIVSQIHEIKRGLLSLRRAIWPLREAVNSLFRDSTPLIKEETKIYLRDCYDHTVQIIDLLENYRDLASSLMEVYLSSINNRLNEVIKFLTIFTTIFSPLTFIAGVYGMNFHTEKSAWNMPELTWRLGYPAALGTMLLIAVVMLLYFKRRGWLGVPEKPETGEPKA